MGTRRTIGLLAFAIGALTFGAPVASAAGPPLIGSTWSADVSATAAKLNARVNPNGIASTARFEYLTAAAYEANLASAKDGFAGALKSPPISPSPIGSGSSEKSYLQQLALLQASTAYRYRLVAVNSAATVSSPARTFVTREIAPVFGLPDGRGWEMVSPVDKNGGAVEGPEANFGGGVLQAAAQGGAVTYSSGASFGTSQGAPGASQYLSRRGAGGWSTENVTVPLFSGGYDSSPTAGVPYQLFSPDLAAGLLTNGRRCRGEGMGCPVANPPLPGSGAPAGYRNYYRRDGGGGYQALMRAADVAGLAAEDFEVAFSGASPDLGQVVLSSCSALTAAATETPGGGGECDPAATNLYRWNGSGLALVNVLPGDTQGAPGAALAAQAGAIAPDGSRVYWTVAGDLYLREGAQTHQVAAGASFETAAGDGSVAFFSKEGHLYRYPTATKVATDLTPSGGVQGVLGAAADGSRVYYRSASGLLLWSNGATITVAAEADVSNAPPTTGTARVSPDGGRLVFLSKAGLTGYDNNGETEVYLFDLAGPTLTCVSCNPTGQRPIGPSTISGAIANGAAFRAYKPRNLAAGDSRVYFDSFDAIAPQDTNADRDVYQWQAQGSGSCAKPGGCVSLISSGRSEDGASFVDASADGSDVFFTTDASLVPGDPGSVDLYDARVGGGFPVPPAPIPCIGDACQALPGEPEDPTPGTSFLRPEGNPPVSYPKSGGKKSKGKKAKKRKGGGKKAKGKKGRGGR